MIRILFTGALIAIIYVVGTLLVDTISDFTNNASLIVSGINRTEIKNKIREYVNDGTIDTSIILEDADIQIKRTHINSDTDEDIIATIETKQTCGTGGCMTVILLNDGTNHFTLIPFKYTVKSIDAESNITNGMHDLGINDNHDTRMIWDGEQYRFNAQ